MSESNNFCGKCGANLEPNNNFCTKCGSPNTNTSNIENTTKKPITKKKKYLWYIAPIILGLIGGIIAYFVLRKDEPILAKRCLMIGIGIAILGIIVLAISGQQEFQINYGKPSKTFELSCMLDELSDSECQRRWDTKQAYNIRNNIIERP